MLSKISKWPRKTKIVISIAADMVIIMFALWSAVALRVGTLTPELMNYWWIFVVVPLLGIIYFYFLGLYKLVVRFSDEKIILTIIFGVTLTFFTLIALAFSSRLSELPRSSAFIFWLLAIVFIVMSRYVAKFLFSYSEQKTNRKELVAIYGAGRAGLQTALSLISGREFHPIAFFDDKEDLQGTTLVGIKIYSPVKALEIMAARDCRQLLIAMPSISRSQRRSIVQKFEGKDLILKTLPGIGELVHGSVRLEDIREVGVEDLLGRDPVPPYPELITKAITDMSVLVSGAGGSIGSELCRQIIKYKPKKLILFEQNEYSLYRIERDLLKYDSLIPIIPVLGDILDHQTVRKVLTDYKVETVYHAAAYKHVPMVEANLNAAIRNNVLGTLTFSEIAVQLKVKFFVLISTDKAVRPTNMMGATKRLAELILQGLANNFLDTRISIVRFGNVLGSSGSVVPLFKEQIRLGGPVTVTHQEVTRYFMTIPEAAQLVLQASAIGKSGEVFVLDMGEPIKIADLAKKMIELSGFEVRNLESDTGDITIEFVGLRPGEKLYEELLIGENVKKTVHPRILAANEQSMPFEVLRPILVQLIADASTVSDDQIRQRVQQLVPEYNPKLES